MSALGPYLPWLAWAFLPSLATDLTLKLLYSSSLLARPQTPNSAIKQSSRVRALLVAAYLTWSFYTTIASRELSAYELLGLDLDSSVEQVKRAFRRMAMLHHPDKVGAQGERFFIALRRSHDVLSDPVKRFAYDRFGMSVLHWKDALSYREHMVIGLRNTLMFWIVNPIIYLIVSWLSSDKSAFSYWHFTFLFTLAVTEVHIISQPSRPAVLELLMPRLTVHDTVLVLHQVYTTSTMAVRQLLPFLSSPLEQLSQGPKTLKEAQVFLDTLAGEMLKLTEVANQVEASTQKLWEMDALPLVSTLSGKGEMDSSNAVASCGSNVEGLMGQAAGASPFNEMRHRYARLTSDAILLRSIDGVAPDFRKQSLLSKVRGQSSHELAPQAQQPSESGKRLEGGSSSSLREEHPRRS